MAEAEHPSVFLQQMIHGGIINNSDIARKIAEILIVALYGEDELARQEPLEITDQDGLWVIQGSHNKDRKNEGAGSFHVELRRRDCQVMKIYVETVPPPPPEDVKEIVQQELRKRQRELK